MSYETTYSNELRPLKALKPRTMIRMGGNNYIIERVTEFWVYLRGNGFEQKIGRTKLMVEVLP